MKLPLPTTVAIMNYCEMKYGCIETVILDQVRLNGLSASTYHKTYRPVIKEFMAK